MRNRCWVDDDEERPRSLCTMEQEGRGAYHIGLHGSRKLLRFGVRLFELGSWSTFSKRFHRPAWYQNRIGTVS
jgi:hypothetical protein